MSFDFLLVMLAVLGIARATRFLGNTARNAAAGSNIAARKINASADGVVLAASALGVGAFMYVLSALNFHPAGLDRAEVGIRLTSISRATEGYWAIILTMAAYYVTNRAIRWNPKGENHRKRLITITTGIFAAVVLVAQTILLTPPVAKAATYGHSFYPQDSTTSLVKNTVKGSLLGVGPPLAYLTTGAATVGRAPATGTGNTPGIRSASASRVAVNSNKHLVPGYETRIAEYVSEMPASTGYLPESNIAYMISLFAARDPMLPKIYLTSWADALGVPVTALVPKEVTGPDNVFSPTMLTPNLARLYGVRYLFVSTYAPDALQLLARPLKPGLQLAAKAKGFELVRVVGAHRFSLEGTTGTVDAIRWKGDNQVSVTVTAADSGRLIARITALPGWHATVDGVRATTTTVDKIMLGVPVVRGTSTVTLTYWPATFSLGIAAALAGLAVIVLMVLVDLRHRRLLHKRHSHAATA